MADALELKQGGDNGKQLNAVRRHEDVNVIHATGHESDL